MLRLALVLTAVTLTGCGSVSHLLPDHSAQSRTAPQFLEPGERVAALSATARLPAPGGIELTLASEDPAIVAVERVAGSGGSAETFLVARAPGRTTVHYANRYAVGDGRLAGEKLRAASLGAFTVEVGRRPMPGSDTTTPHRYSIEEIGTAIVQDVRDGHIFFDFTTDAGATDRGLRVRTAEISHLQGAVIEPTARLRLKLVRHYLQLGTTTPREIGQSWELMRAP